jgi:hypothetical protein
MGFVSNLVGMGVCLDLHRLDVQPFWLDEAISESIGLSSGSAFVKTVVCLAFSQALCSLPSLLDILGSSPSRV